MKLTDEQQAVVTARDSRLLVQAYAGTGKTETVAHRVAQLKSEDKKPLMLCFTRAAQSQLTRRLDTLKVDAEARTLHSLAFELVRNYHAQKGYDMPLLLETNFIITHILRQAGFDASHAEIDMIQRFSTYMMNGSTNGSLPLYVSMNASEIRDLVHQYWAEKQRLSYVDFDDVILMASEIVRNWRGEVVVDEAQDLSNIQVRFLNQLTGDDTNVTWVGDANQSIYGFAGVDSQLFAKRSDWAQLTLSKSFRSAREILELANQLIPDTMHSDIYGGRVTVRDDAFSMWAYYLAKWSSSGSAIIARTNKELDELARGMELEGINVSRRHVERHANAMLTWQPPTFLLTAHAAKGLEFERVAVIGIDDSSWQGFAMSAEECRLFYVAVTRAKQDLTLFTRTGDLPFEVEM